MVILSWAVTETPLHYAFHAVMISSIATSCIIGVKLQTRHGGWNFMSSLSVKPLLVNT